VFLTAEIYNNIIKYKNLKIMKTAAVVLALLLSVDATRIQSKLSTKLSSKIAQKSSIMINNKDYGDLEV
jgi:hypothetical protein